MRRNSNWKIFKA